MKLLIKNMVCPRCIMSVEEILKTNSLPYQSVRLGEIELVNSPNTEQLNHFNADLQKIGFEILDDQKKKQIEKIKTTLIQKVQSGDIEEHFSLTENLSKELHKEYTHISRLFSEVEGMTIEQYFILQKVEKVKEWLVYNDLPLVKFPGSWDIAA